MLDIAVTTENEAAIADYQRGSADDVERLLRRARVATATYRSVMAEIISEAGSRCNSIDADDEIQALDDGIFNLSSDGFNNWAEYIGRMQRGDA